jgi:C_GCAxxG_C_C family probable redox protein
MSDELREKNKEDEMNSKSDAAVAVMDAGGNCAQAVLSVFCAALGLEKGTALRIASGFGAGMAREQEVCGALTGGIMAIGLKHGQERAGDKEAKEKTYALTRELLARFRSQFGACRCLDLLGGCDLKTEAGQKRFSDEGLLDKVCHACVRGAVRVLEEIL